jgi:DNA-binding transcriptional LysR family regulator
MRQAAVEGLGIAFLPDWVAGDDINSGALVQLFPEMDATTCIYRNICFTRVTSPACQSHGVSRRIA